MSKEKFVNIGLLLCVFLAACSSVKIVNTEGENNFVLSKYKTFEFYQVDTQGDGTSADYMQKVEILKKAISKPLVNRGLTQAATEPDLLVNLGIVVDEKVQTRQTDFRTDAPIYIGQRRYSWKSQQVEVGRYKLGTVTVHLVDNEQNTMVWRGVAQGVVPARIQKLEKTVNKGAEKLFANIPVEAR
jgi:hypothetical protein